VKIGLLWRPEATWAWGNEKRKEK